MIPEYLYKIISRGNFLTGCLLLIYLFLFFRFGNKPFDIQLHDAYLVIEYRYIFVWMMIYFIIIGLLYSVMEYKHKILSKWIKAGQLLFCYQTVLLFPDIFIPSNYYTYSPFLTYLLIIFIGFTLSQIIFLFASAILCSKSNFYTK